MGHVSSVALGMTIACPEKKIVVFDGDAAAMMHMGSLATIGRYQPKNLIHIVLNNGVNESVGGQPSSGYVVNLTGVAKNCGFQTTDSYLDIKDDLLSALEKVSDSDRPVFIDVHVRQGIRKDMPKLGINHSLIKCDLMYTLAHP